ncbi:MAG: PhzF family phenazine biosynthesis protein [Solirubrobacterales bacterium]|nr:PhzF family phenazine biosynthesis protein [Solirubrobacterales bacterium]MBV9942933.1 PhzF family phenazine biosynthesis protein [Solirubrobacterales bacterium]
MKMYRYTVADVFTDTPLQGNPVAVFTDASGLSSEVMQRAAREMNLSETVFLMRSSVTGAHVRARIFTPAIELPFAGHPVLGAAFVVGRAMGSPVVRLETGLGVVPVTLTRGGGGADPVFGEMEQPVPVAEPFAAVSELLRALDVDPFADGLPIEAYRNGPVHVYVEFPSAQAVAALSPDIGALGRLGAFGINCFAGAGGRWKNRMFGPALGVAEDPATGSAAGPLAVHLARHGRIEFGSQIEIEQGVEIGRRSALFARVEGVSGQIERITVGGSAVIVARGEYRLE